MFSNYYTFRKSGGLKSVGLSGRNSSLALDAEDADHVAVFYETCLLCKEQQDTCEVRRIYHHQYNPNTVPAFTPSIIHQVTVVEEPWVAPWQHHFGINSFSLKTFICRLRLSFLVLDFHLLFETLISCFQFLVCKILAFHFLFLTFNSRSFLV